jgi:predicted nuclease with TOPRIM domain
MKLQQLTIVLAGSMLMLSCVSSKKYQDLNKKYDELNTSYTGVQGDLRTCRDEKSELERKRAASDAEIESLKKQMDYLKQSNNQAIETTGRLSVITGRRLKASKNQWITLE